MANDPRCLNCDEPVETIMHRLIECPLAREAWLKLEEFKVNAGLSALTTINLDNILGANEPTNKTELSLQAELIHRLASRNKIHSTTLLVKTVVRVIANCEPLGREMMATFNRLISEM